MIYPDDYIVSQKITIKWEGLKQRRVPVRNIRKGFAKRRYLSGALKNKQDMGMGQQGEEYLCQSWLSRMLLNSIKFYL